MLLKVRNICQILEYILTISRHSLNYKQGLLYGTPLVFLVQNNSFHALFLIAWLVDVDSLMCCIVTMGRLIAKMSPTFSLWGYLFLMSFRLQFCYIASTTCGLLQTDEPYYLPEISINQAVEHKIGWEVDGLKKICCNQCSPYCVNIWCDS